MITIPILEMIPMIKGIISILSLLWILLVGTPSNAKHSLYKQPTREDFSRNLNCWIQRNFYIIALAAILTLLVSFVLFMFWCVGVSAVESGNYYNHMGGVI